MSEGVASFTECKRTRTPHTYMVLAGTEHERFKNLFPFWEDDKSVQALNCKVLWTTTILNNG